MKNFRAHVTAFLLMFIIFMPMVTGADTISERLFVCDGTKNDPCDFAALVLLAQNIITILVEIGTWIAVLLAIKIGFDLITAGARGDSNALSKAKASGLSLLKGYFVILIAWLVVYTITNALLQDGYSILGSPRTN